MIKRCRHAIRLAVEVLEDRATPAVISWINPVGGSWNEPSNWDLGRTPQPFDDVVIRSLNFLATVEHDSGADTVDSITSPLDEATLAVTNSSSLTITGTINISTLEAQNGGVVTADTADNLQINLLAQDGGEIHLPSLTAYHGHVLTTIEATGAGSVIDMPALTTLMATTDPIPGEVRLDLYVDQGGTMNLPALTSVLGHPPDFIIGVTALSASHGGTFLLDTTQSLTLDASAFLMVDPATDLQAGNIIVGTSGELTVHGSLEAASLDMRGNAIIDGTVSVGGDFTMTQSTTDLQAGIVTVGGVFDNEGGTVYGSATINGNVINAGLLSVGTVTINGDYVQTAAGQLILHLRSTGDFDQLLVSGLATLDGTLNLNLASGYQPQPGDQLQVVQFGAGAGAFTHLGGNAPVLGVLYVYQPGSDLQPGVTVLF